MEDETGLAELKWGSGERPLKILAAGSTTRAGVRDDEIVTAGVEAPWGYAMMQPTTEY